MAATKLSDSASNFSQALQWVDHGDSITVSKGQLTRDHFIARRMRGMSSKKNQKKVNETARFIIENLKTGITGDSKVKELAERFVKDCAKKKLSSREINLLDRLLHAESGNYMAQGNQTDFKRWKQWGFEPGIFQKHYEFAKYLLETPLGNQMKIFKDPIIVKEGQPGILVEGKWMAFEELKDRFKVEYSKEHKEKFMMDQKSGEVYTFLDNGKGLQSHHPYLVKTPTPILSLNHEDYQRTLEVARKFVREGETAETSEKNNEERTFVLQIVSSYVDEGPKTNAHELLARRKHPWIRIISGQDNPDLGTKKGDVFEAGYNWSSSTNKLPALTSSGRFRAEDMWNYKRPAQRVVTNIAISREEAHKVMSYTLGYHTKNIETDDKIAFNLLRQNCSAFVHHVVKQANIKAPTKIFFTDLIREVSPNWIKAIGRGLSLAGSKTKKAFNNTVSWVPSPIKRAVKGVTGGVYHVTHAIFDAMAAGLVGTFSFALGGAFGKKGMAFTKNPDDVKQFSPTLLRFKNFFSLKKFYYHLPGKLQEWQRKQPSTVVYENPVKISVVPPQV